MLKKQNLAARRFGVFQAAGWLTQGFLIIGLRSLVIACTHAGLQIYWRRVNEFEMGG
jgi:hypothetical protein